MNDIFIKANTIKDLNHAIVNSIRISKPSSTLKLHITLGDGSATGWWIKTSKGNPAKHANCNGLKCVLTKTHETNTDLYFFASPFWCSDIIPDNQLLEIEFHGTYDPQETQLVASTRLSIWHLFQLIRKDLPNHSRYKLNDWIIGGGLRDLNIIDQEIATVSSLNENIKGTPFSRFHASIWNQREDLQSTFGLIQPNSFFPWLHEHGIKEYGLNTLNKSNCIGLSYKKSKPFTERPFGVNLFGYSKEALGIGEDVRTAKAALDAHGIPTTIIDIPTHQIPEKLRKQAKNDSEKIAPFAFNLFCFTAEEYARVILELGYNVIKERYNIGYWPWELSAWPTQWKPLLGCVDEVWASSSHTYNTLMKEAKNISSAPIKKCALGINDIKPLTYRERTATREQFQLPSTNRLIICSFDGRSSFARKNPWGAIKAFQTSFDESKQSKESPHLVIKTMHASIDQDEWDKLKRIADDDERIHLIDQKLDRLDLVQLYGSCDVLLSLHRAEGFGRIMAECFLLGLEVVATNYSGNTDFCAGPLYHPVDYELTFVPQRAYAYTEFTRQHWAEPSIEHASLQLKKATSKQIKNLQDKKELHSFYAKILSITNIGINYKQRLEELWLNKNNSRQQLVWDNSSSIYNIDQAVPF